ncbi:contactin-like [Haliotis rubra]|uniref:contactin-like n=1 Tax=Haliotis rubra TaxID=36100 RepID=UPI001EE53F76|nr:contactin-like [Haliotis rubra]
MRLHIISEACVLLVLLSLDQTGGQAYDCPLGWDEYGQKCYHFVIYPPRVYAEAMAACQADGASLVSVNDAGEHRFISQWLTKNDGNRQDLWFTSGTGDQMNLKWEGDGSVSQLGQNWWLETTDYNLTNQIVVYKYSVPLGEFGWSRSPKSAVLSYICEISRNEAFRITQAVRDYTYGQDITDPSLIPRGPKFLNRNPDIVIAGRNPTASIECSASGSPQPKFTWYKYYGTANQSEVTSSVDERYTLTNGRLTIQNPDATLDMGMYQCTATNSIGTIVSDPIQVSFGYLHEFSNDPPGFQYAALYQGADITCKVPTYNPALTYQWYKNNAAHFVRPELNEYQFISHNGNLYLSEVQQSDAGYYHCVVTLSVPSGQVLATSQPPSRTSLGIELKVGGETAMDFGPTIHNDFPAVFPNPSLRGQNIRLECLAYGKLPLYYSWTRGDGVTNLGLPHNSHLEDHNRVLMIDDVRVEDGGNYTCHVNRGATAADTKSFFVNIESRPYFIFPLRDQFLDVGSQMTWRCQATAIPPAVYSWYKDTELLTSTPGDVEIVGNVLTIKNANAEKHNGMYQCSAINLHGKSFSTAELKVLSPKPDYVPDPLIDWTDGADRGNPIVYYIIEFNTNFNSDWRVMIQRLGVPETVDEDNPDKRTTKLSSLRPGTGYRFRVLAANMFGHGDPSMASSMYHLPSAAPVVVPMEVGGGGGKVGTLTITWQPLSLEDESGPAIGYYVFWRKKTNSHGLWQRVDVFGRIGTTTITVGDKNYYLEYEVMVEAFNSLGRGPNSTVSVIYSAESLPYATPTNIWIDTFNATAIVVYFDAVDDTREAVKGKIIGYQVNFWVEGEPEFVGHSYHYGQRSQAVVIGLIPNYDYWANVQVFNSAGLGPESEISRGSTAGEGPNAYPEYVEVHSNGPNSVYVHWRGISTVPIIEEALQGYILRYWPANSDLRDATDVVIDAKKTQGVITGLEKGLVYKLRVTGFNAGGDGKKAPPVYFTLGQLFVWSEMADVVVRLFMGLRWLMLWFRLFCGLRWLMLWLGQLFVWSEMADVVD